MVGLGSSGVGIGISVHLLDRFTGNAARISSAMTDMTGKTNVLMAANLRAARRLGIGMVLVGGLGLRAMGKAHSAFRDFNWEMVTVGAVTQKTTEDLKNLDRIVKSLAQESIFNPQEIASGSTRLAKAGFELEQIEEALKGIVLLGTATDTPIGGKSGVADMIAKIMRSFDLPASSTSRVADVITKAVNSAAMDMDDAFEALKFLGNTSFNLGLELEDTMAMVGVLANAGVPQGIAGRGLVNALNKIAMSVSTFATKGNKDALKAIGLSPSDIKDAQGNLLPILDILNNMIAGTAKMGNADKIAALAKLLRLRGSRAILPLLSQYNKSGGKTFEEFRDMLNNDSAGEALRVANLRMESAKGVFLIMNDVWDTLKVTFGEAIDTVLTPLFRGLTEVMRTMIEFVKTPVGKWTAIVITGFFGILTVAGLLTIAISSLGLMFTRTGFGIASMLKSMTWAMNMFGASIMRAVGAQKTLNTISWMGLGNQGAVKGKKGFQSAATMAAMTGAGIGGKVGGKGILAMIGRAFTGLVRFIGPLGLMVTILGMIVGWKNLLRGVVVIIGTITNVITLLFDAIIALFTGRIFEVFEKFGDAQRSLGTKGIFANDYKSDDFYEKAGGKEAWDKAQRSKVISNYNKAAMTRQNYGTGENSPTMFKQQINNNIILDDEVIQKEVRNFNNKELADYLTN